jgi:Ca2+/Na+ antiporter
MIYEVISGALMMACFVAGLFFFSFWKKSQDRLFALFSLAFLLLASERLILGYLGSSNEPSSYVYLVRLSAFVIIIFAVADKNRRSS